MCDLQRGVWAQKVEMIISSNDFDVRVTVHP